MGQWVGWWFLGCVLGEGGPRRAPTTVTCTEGTTLRETSPDTVLDDRIQPETQVLQCLDAQGRPTGPHLERYAEDPFGVAVEGTWTEGRVDGRWTVWRPDGAFARQFEYTHGMADGEWLEVTADGRITAVTFAEGAVVALRGLASETEMSEWDQGFETQGRRYQSSSR